MYIGNMIGHGVHHEVHHDICHGVLRDDCHDGALTVVASPLRSLCECFDQNLCESLYEYSCEGLDEGFHKGYSVH